MRTATQNYRGTLGSMQAPGTQTHNCVMDTLRYHNRTYGRTEQKERLLSHVHARPRRQARERFVNEQARKPKRKRQSARHNASAHRSAKRYCTVFKRQHEIKAFNSKYCSTQSKYGVTTITALIGSAQALFSDPQPGKPGYGPGMEAIPASAVIDYPI